MSPVRHSARNCAGAVSGRQRSGAGGRSGRPACGVPNAAPSGQRGFTLIEVMAAFAIFAVLFGVLLQILSTSISNTRRSGDFTQAALLAQS